MSPGSAFTVVSSVLKLEVFSLESLNALSEGVNYVYKLLRGVEGSILYSLRGDSRKNPLGAGRGRGLKCYFVES